MCTSRLILEWITYMCTVYLPPAHKHLKKLHSIAQGYQWIFLLCTCKCILSFTRLIGKLKNWFCFQSVHWYNVVFFAILYCLLLTTVLENLTETPEKQTVEASHPTNNPELSKLLQMVQKFPSKIGILNFWKVNPLTGDSKKKIKWIEIPVHLFLNIWVSWFKAECFF